jgi:hypothetical protein
MHGLLQLPLVARVRRRHGGSREIVAGHQGDYVYGDDAAALPVGQAERVAQCAIGRVGAINTDDAGPSRIPAEPGRSR